MLANLIALQYINLDNQFIPVDYTFTTTDGQYQTLTNAQLIQQQSLLPAGFSLSTTPFLNSILQKGDNYYTLCYNNLPILQYANANVGINFQYVDLNTIPNGVNGFLPVLAQTTVEFQNYMLALQQTQPTPQQVQPTPQPQQTEVIEPQPEVVEPQQPTPQQVQPTSQQVTEITNTQPTTQEVELQQTTTEIPQPPSESEPQSQQPQTFEDVNTKIDVVINTQPSETDFVQSQPEPQPTSQSEVASQPQPAQVNSVASVSFGEETSQPEPQSEVASQPQPTLQSQPQSQVTVNGDVREANGIKYTFIDNPGIDYERFGTFIDDFTFKTLDKFLPTEVCQRLYMYLTSSIDESIIETFWGLINTDEKWALLRLIILEGDTQQSLWGNLVPYLWLYKQACLEVNSDLDSKTIEFKLIDKYLKSTLNHEKQNITEYEDDEKDSDDASITFTLDKKSPEWTYVESFLQTAPELIAQCSKPEELSFLEAICSDELDTTSLQKLIGVPNVDFRFTRDSIECSYFGTPMSTLVVFELLKTKKDYQITYLSEVAFQLARQWLELSDSDKILSFAEDVCATVNGVTSQYKFKDLVVSLKLPGITKESTENLPPINIVNLIGEIVNRIISNSYSNIRNSKSLYEIYTMINAFNVLYSIYPANTVITDDTDPRRLQGFVTIANERTEENIKGLRESLNKINYNTLLTEKKSKYSALYSKYKNITLLESLDLQPKYVVVGVHEMQPKSKLAVVGIIYYNQNNTGSASSLVYIPVMGYKLFDAFLSDSLKVNLPDVCKSIGEVTLPDNSKIRVLKAQNALSTLPKLMEGVSIMKINLNEGTTNSLDLIYTTIYKNLNSIVLPSWVENDKENVNKAIATALHL